MGAFKPLLPIGGVPAAQRLISSIYEAGIDNIVLVTGNRAEELENSLRHMNVTFLRNDMYEHNEMFDSIRIGVGHLKTQCNKILISPVDVPLFTVETVKTLLKSNASIAIPTYDNKPGHPVAIGGRAIFEILEYSGNGGLRCAIADLSLDIENIIVNDCGILYDMDTQEDYAAIVKMQQSANRL